MTLSELKKKGVLFFILDKKDNKSIAIIKEVTGGYDGFVFDNSDKGKLDFSPMYIAKTFIENEESRYEFTSSFNDAVKNLSLHKPLTN